MARMASAGIWGRREDGVRKAGEGRRARREGWGHQALRDSLETLVVLGHRVPRVWMGSPEWWVGGRGGGHTDRERGATTSRGCLLLFRKQWKH